MRENSPAGIIEAVQTLNATRLPAAETRAYAERFGWDDTSAGQMQVFRRVLNRP